MGKLQNHNIGKKCHSADDKKNLDYMISRLPGLLPPSVTIIDGIYSLERVPSFDGKPLKSDLVIASSHPVAADLVVARVLGYDPEDILYLKQAASDVGLSTDLSVISMMGESTDGVAAFS